MKTAKNAYVLLRFRVTSPGIRPTVEFWFPYLDLRGLFEQVSHQADLLSLDPHYSDLISVEIFPDHSAEAQK